MQSFFHQFVQWKKSYSMRTDRHDEANFAKVPKNYLLTLYKAKVTVHTQIYTKHINEM